MRILFVSTMTMCACVGHAAEVVVDGRCNIFGAGHAVPPAPDGGGGGFLPAGISLIGHDLGYVELTNVSGAVTAGSGFPYNGADGGTSASGTTDVLSWGGISGVIHANRTLFLTGVFLGPASPSDPAPPRLDVTNANSVTEFWPMLAQTFFMGDGQDAASNMQRFNVPAGATRLFLGFVDAFDFGNPTNPPGHYDDNRGTLRVVTNVVPAPGVALMTLGLAGVYAKRRAR